MNRSIPLRFYPYPATPSARDVEATDSVPLGEEKRVDAEILALALGGSADVPLVACSVEGSNDGENWEATATVEIVDIAAALLLVGQQETLRLNLKSEIG